MNLRSLITENILVVTQKLYPQAGIVAKDIFLEHPNNEDFGDYATNIAMTLAKMLKQNPLEIAKNVCYGLEELESTEELDGKKYPVFYNINFAPPGFVNFKVSSEWLYNVLEKIVVESFDYGSADFGGGKRIALEHSNVNPNKAAHVGHLRNACIGQFIERAYEKLNYNVEVQYLDNDLGVQVTTSLMGLDYITDVSPHNYEKFDHFAWDIYSRMEAMIENDESLKQKRQEIMMQLEDENNDFSKKQVELSQKILVEQLKTFQKLDFDYDVIIRERDIVTLKLWERAFELLKKNESVYLAQEGPSKGCWLIKMPSSPIGSDLKEKSVQVEEDKIIVRSNGVPTYTGKDIAYHMWKFGLLDADFYYRSFDMGTQEKPLWITTSQKVEVADTVSFSNCDMVFNVIDVKQTYAIDVVKKSLLYLNYEKEAENMKHINYGFVYLSPATAQKLGIDTSDEKQQYGMSGRKGWGIKIDDLIQAVAGKLIMEHGVFETLPVVCNGAIKFEMLKYNTFQDIVFDLNSALNMQGYSGPYIQYAHARAKSVLAKTDFEFDHGVFVYDLEKTVQNMTQKELSVLRMLYQYPELAWRAADEFAPNLLCNYLFELAQKFNSFYNDAPILTAETNTAKRFRVTLTIATAQILKNGLYLLGIKAPDKM